MTVEYRTGDLFAQGLPALAQGCNVQKANRKWNHDHIWENADRIRAAVEESKSLGQVLVNLGIEPSGNRYDKLRLQCAKFGIHLDFPEPAASAIRTPDELVFCRNSVYGRNNGANLKARALKLGHVTNRCTLCGQPPEWNGISLVLQLDHIDGDHRNNQPDNLRMLCPNCHAQTPTHSWAGNGPKVRR